MSATIQVESNRRLWITATSAVGGARLVASAVPFVASLAPGESARALGGPVEVELQGLLTGELQTVQWRGKPVFILRRSQDMLDMLDRHDDLLADSGSRQSDQPGYARNVRAPQSRRSRCWKAFARTWDVFPRFARRPAPLTSAPHGQMTSTARVMDRSSISPGVSSRACRRRPSSRYRRIGLPPIPPWSSASIQRPEPSTCESRP